ncbi:MAG: phosphoribosylformylglycinamidine synthase subunit PurQ [Chloroflexota bacterium]|nr:phosphoribosylformylglycinamidine synthase subunit PurQ [Chloroflexota bacterium]
MAQLKFGVLVFPGSNGDTDCLYLLNTVLGVPAEAVWHGERRVAGYDCLILPGGFSYGDYLRAGAIARFAPVMGALRDFAAAGRPVLGICNGFQILTEAGILPGALLRNGELAFSSRPIQVRVEAGATATPFTAGVTGGAVWRLPIAHGEGRYFAAPETLAEIEANRQVVLRYCEADGAISDAANPNGSSHGIAGICNAAGNVLGLMPHPERAGEALLGMTDGLHLFHALIAACRGAAGDRALSHRPVAAGR